MAQLIYAIDGDLTGLANTINQAIGLIKQLDSQSGKIKFGSEGLQTLPATLSNIASGINQVKASADSANVSLSFAKGVQALDQLGSKLAVITGNSILFGDSLKAQEQELAAYQGALNKLLALGFEPLGADVTLLKTKIDDLTASIAAQNAVSIKVPQSTIVDKTQFTEPLADVATNTTGLTGAQVLIRDLDADLAAGKITAQEYAASIALIGQQTTATNIKLEQEEGILVGLKSQLDKLKTARINIADPADLAKQNALIQELEAEIGRLNNVGKTGFDAAGNSVQSFGKNIENTRTPVENLGKGLTRGFTYLRQIAYILPGIGIAGIFNLAFEGIAKAADGLDLFNTKLNQAKQNELALNSVLENTGKIAAGSQSNFKILTAAISDTTSSMKDRIDAAEELKKEFSNELANTSALTIVNKGLGASYDAITRSIYQQAAAEATISAIKDQESKKNALIAQQLEIQAKANLDIAKVKSPIEQGATGSSLTGAIQAQTISIAQQKKGIQDLADFRKNKIAPEIAVINNVIDQIIDAAGKEGEKLAKTLEGTNKLIQEPLKNFDAIIKASGSKADFENLKAALQAKLNALAPGDAQIAVLRAKILQVEEIIRNVYDIKLTKGGINIFANLQDELDKLIAKSNSLAASSGLTGYAAQVQKIASAFADIDTALSSLQGKVNRDLKSGKITSGQAAGLTSGIQGAQTQASLNEQRSLAAALVTEREKTNNDLQAIDDAFGVKQEQSRKRELADVQKLANDKISAIQAGLFTQEQIQNQFNASVAAANGNKDQIKTAQLVRDAEIQAAQDGTTEIIRIRQGLLSAQDAVNQKYLQKEQQLESSISDLQNQAIEDLSDKETNATNKIVASWGKRKTEAAKYFDQLRAIYPELSAIITKQQDTTNALFDQAKFKDVSVELSKNFASAMQSGVSTFVQDFYTSITTLGQQRQTIDDKYRQEYASATDDLTRQQIAQQEQIEKSATLSFGSIFSSLVSSAFSSFNKSILDSFTKKFTENIGSTLISPNSDQLGIKVSGQQFSNSVTSAAQSFSAIINQAATALSLKLNPPTSIAGISGGLSADNAELGASSAGGQIAADISGAGDAFNGEVDSAGNTFSSNVVSASNTASTVTTGAATTAAGHISSASAGIAAAASLLGGFISGATSPTSSAGQGIGGALQGAGEGALIGSVFGPEGTIIGAAAGGLIGLASGLLGASKAKKQEELQQKQLEQQQETNALLARQNALAYTSSIIGRMTTQGIITGADINAFGELTATVSGKDLQFVLSRNGNGR